MSTPIGGNLYTLYMKYINKIYHSYFPIVAVMSLSISIFTLFLGDPGILGLYLFVRMCRFVCSGEGMIPSISQVC